MPRFLLGVVLGTAALVTAAVSGQTVNGRDPERVALPNVVALPGTGRAALSGPPEYNLYTGSASCQRCHEVEYDSWRRTLHVQMTRPVGEARIAGDFTSGARLEADGRAYTMEARGGKYFISVARNGGPAERFEINYTLGARRFQGYLSTLSDGRIYVLPVFWHNESKRWVDYRTITPIPDDPTHDLRQIWNVTCVNCHATNLVRNYNVAANTFATTWTEMGVGCEACHGPGRDHIDDPDHLKIFTMKKVPPRQIFDACGYCHGNKNNVFLGFKAGDVYEDYAVPFLISEPIPANDPQGDFWPDGRPSRFDRPQALTLTGCFRKGEATCTSCHRMHGSENNHSLKVAIDAPGGGHTRASDTLCTQCHSRLGSEGSEGSEGSKGSPHALEAHTHHAADSQGSRCINCHMSDVNWRLLTRRLDHTFQPPVPEMTARYGVPNACTTCHENKTPEWAVATMDNWYGDRSRRLSTVALADTMYRAGAGDVSVLPEVTKLIVDRSRGALIRASAAEFAGRLIGSIRGSQGAQDSQGSGSSIDVAIVNALIGGASDSEPMVRITAVRSLGLLDDLRIVPVLFAKLVDPARVVRVRAAEALLNMSVTTAEGAPGQALAAAQDEWLASLRSFDDVSYNHLTLSRLFVARGNTEEAVRELNVAIRLDPSDARPHVSLGVLAARAGRFAAAVQQFKTAKALAPSYPNIDRLIEEAAKRR